MTKGAHAERFSGRVQAYAAYRPRFPRRRILTFLREHGALRENAVLADIGAGTGMLAELFLEAGHRVIAIEPNEMRRACRELTARYLDLEVVKGSAEATTLPNTSVDLITVGRAMHWFDWRQAHREFGRILRAKGWVLIATNGHPDTGAPVSEMLAALFRRWRSDAAAARRQPDFHERLRCFLDASTWQRARLDDSMTVDFASLLGYAESLSAMPRPGDAEYGEMLAELRGVFDRFQQQGVLVMPVVCELFLGRLRAEYAAVSDE